jgi:hypothetical protein
MKKKTSVGILSAASALGSLIYLMTPGLANAAVNNGSFSVTGGVFNSKTLDTSSYDDTSKTAGACITADNPYSADLIWYNGGKNTVIRHFSSSVGTTCTGRTNIPGARSGVLKVYLAIHVGPNMFVSGTYSINTY